MPQLGMEEVAAHHPEKRPHIVVFTAAGKRGVDKIPADSVCSAILKPFDLDKFIDTIAECLRGDHEARAMKRA